MSPILIVALLVLLVITASGLFCAWRHRHRRHSLEDFVSARGSAGPLMATLSLVASGLGSWILFGPAESAVSGGLLAVLAYPLGCALALCAYIPLGLRLRRLAPGGHTLPEYIWHRYGRPMYALVWCVMLFYMGIYLCAEVTGMALILQRLAAVPPWLTASSVLAAILTYTIYGGLRASIFTDAIQFALILPLFALLVTFGLASLGSPAALHTALQTQRPDLLSFSAPAGWDMALTLVIGIVTANLFHQGFWQRVFAVRDTAALKSAFAWGAVIVIPLVALMGVFGLAAVALAKASPSSTALFNVLDGRIPPWLLLCIVAMALALVMGSADTLLNGIASLVATDLARLLPSTPAPRLLNFARLAAALATLPVLWVASQGYSVLYLFFLADMICAAAVLPVFLGLYLPRYRTSSALIATAAGLLAGALLFPNPAFTRGSILGSFLAALAAPALVSLLLPLAPPSQAFDLSSLARRIRPIPD